MTSRNTQRKVRRLMKQNGWTYTQALDNIRSEKTETVKYTQTEVLEIMELAGRSALGTDESQIIARLDSNLHANIGLFPSLETEGGGQHSAQRVVASWITTILSNRYGLDVAYLYHPTVEALDDISVGEADDPVFIILAPDAGPQHIDPIDILRTARSRLWSVIYVSRFAPEENDPVKSFLADSGDLIVP